MNKPVYDLHKKEEKNHIFSPVYNFDEKLEAFILSHASFFFILALVTLAVLFVVLCYALVGVSAVESGGMRNFLAGGV